MTEYIEREAAIDAMENADYATIADYAESCKADYLREVIKSVPAADVAPVVHAEWQPLWFDDEDRMLGEPPSDYMCSNCKIISADDSDYCPHCGALMDGGESDDLTETLSVLRRESSTVCKHRSKSALHEMQCNHTDFS